MSNIDTHLGQKSPRIEQYTPSLLVREERQNNRYHIGVTDDEKPPFVGYDVWNLWEVSALQNNGLPVTALGKLIYSVNNKYIVESKSLKLYFNSFNMTKLGETSADVLANIQKMAEKDLSELLGTTVTLQLFDSENCSQSLPIRFTGMRLEDHFNPSCTQYKEDKNLLKIDSDYREKNQTQRFFSTLLKSNCKVTSQKDEATIFIHYKGYNAINVSSLLQYIVSFRDINEFHESTLETIYMRLTEVYNPEELIVAALYTRRGGISISPIRANKPELLKDIPLIDPLVWTQTIRQ